MINTNALLKNKTSNFSKLSLAAVLLFVFALLYALKVLLPHFPEPIGSRSDMFIEGAECTLSLTALASVMGLSLGLLCALAQLSGIWVLDKISAFFVWLIRGTPLLVQILFAYYAVPVMFPSIVLNEFTASVLALSLNVGAYNAEVIRAGIQALPRGQSEAAQSLGLNPYQKYRYILIPQAFRIVAPPLVNNVVALLKDSSLASSIGLLELTLAGNRVSSETFQPVPVLTTIACVYLLQTTCISIVASFFERANRRKKI